MLNRAISCTPDIYRTANISCTAIVGKSWNRGKTEFIRAELAVKIININGKTST